MSLRTGGAAARQAARSWLGLVAAGGVPGPLNIMGAPLQLSGVLITEVVEPTGRNDDR